MHPFPHHYYTTAQTTDTTVVKLSSPAVPTLDTDAPAEFGGPGDKWSPETLIVGSVAECFILTFRAIARASSFAWESMTCDVDGTLEKPEGKTRFTHMAIKARLKVPAGADADRAKRLLEKAEANCLITQSLNAAVHLETVVE